ncbi:MAG: DUF2530 domain-containing protein [Nocardioidaceae bacterium]
MEEPPKEQVRTRTVGNRTYLVADVEPLDVDGTRTVAVGTGLWLLAFVLLLPFYGELQQSHRLWVLWTCLAGFGLGVLGWDYCRRRRKRRQALLAGPSEDPGEDPA